MSISRRTGYLPVFELIWEIMLVSAKLRGPISTNTYTATRSSSAWTGFGRFPSRRIATPPKGAKSGRATMHPSGRTGFWASATSLPALSASSLWKTTAIPNPIAATISNARPISTTYFRTSPSYPTPRYGEAILAKREWGCSTSSAIHEPCSPLWNYNGSYSEIYVNSCSTKHGRPSAISFVPHLRASISSLIRGSASAIPPSTSTKYKKRGGAGQSVTPPSLCRHRVRIRIACSGVRARSSQDRAHRENCSISFCSYETE
jgi:hypothetical protein